MLNNVDIHAEIIPPNKMSTLCIFVCITSKIVTLMIIILSDYSLTLKIALWHCDYEIELYIVHNANKQNNSQKDVSLYFILI